MITMTDGEGSMNQIYFRGGDMHGRTLTFDQMPADVRLLFDGRGGPGSPRGLYIATDEYIAIDDSWATVFEHSEVLNADHRDAR